MAESKHIIAGFAEDLDLIKCEYLSASPDLRLEDFLVYWNKAHLDCLFANRFDPRELLETISEMNRKLVAIVTDDSLTCESRTVALYMLFCLAVKQPERMRRKIRLTCSDAINITGLCEIVGQAKGHQGTKFCWRHLRSKDCIDFVEERLVYGPSMLGPRGGRKQATESEMSERADVLAAEKADTREYIYSKLEPSLKQLESMCTQYNLMRNQLQLDSVSEPTAVDLESAATVSGHLERAKSLLMNFKTSENL